MSEANDATVRPWERSLIAAEKVKERLLRATKALADAGVPYAVVGGNAVAEWVARVDNGAVRNTRDVDLLINRSDLGELRSTLESVGFVYQRHGDADMFVDGPQGRPSSGIHLVCVGERVRPDHEQPAPGLDESERAADFQVVNLDALIRMKLLSWRDKDRPHLRDMIGVGLIDASWPARFSPLLGKRLQELLDNPDG